MDEAKAEMTVKARKVGLIATLFGTSVAFLSPVLAQAKFKSEDSSGENVVTARKRAEALIDVDRRGLGL